MKILPGKRPDGLGVLNGLLKTVPNSPNCVSSQSESPRHKIAPLTYTDNPDQAMQRLRGIIEGMDRSEIIQGAKDYLYAEFSSRILGYVDDVEFYFPKEDKIVHVRSGSRLGYSDMGVNRKRIETIRDKFTQ